jgi:hypothetical protein
MSFQTSNTISSDNIRYWSKQEETDLEHEIRLRIPISEIAEKHQRSTRAIEYRIATIFQNRKQNGMSHSDIVSEFKIPLKEVIQYTQMEIPSFKQDYKTEQNKKIEERITILEERIEKLEKIIKKMYNKVVKK